MRAIVAQVRTPAFSVRQPHVYQVAVSFPLPPPSTLVGFLAFAVAQGGLPGVAGGLMGDEYIEKLSNYVLSYIVRAVATPIKPLARRSVVLSRIRALEESSEKVARQIERGKRISDAMIREYYHGTLGLIYVLKDDDYFVDEAIKSLYLAERIGDTESLVSVVRVEEAKLERLDREGYVDTYTPLSLIESFDGDTFSLIKMQREELAGKVKRTQRDLEKYSEKYIVPLAEKKIGREEHVLLERTKVKVKVKEGFYIWRVKTGDFNVHVVLPKGDSG